jgi:hypothetical protein
LPRSHSMSNDVRWQPTLSGGTCGDICRRGKGKFSVKTDT